MYDTEKKENNEKGSVARNTLSSARHILLRNNGAIGNEAIISRAI